MKLARFDYQGQRLIGVVDGDGLRPLAPGTDMLELLCAAPEERARVADQAGEEIELGDVKLLAPLKPRSIRDFMVFEEHVEGVSRNFRPEGGVLPAWYGAPAFYFSNPEAMVGPHDDVPVPPGCDVFDFELEVAAIIGGTGRDVPVEKAADLIVGYTILNDWSARDLQSRERVLGLGPSKGKDCGMTLGPWIVTPDEISAFRGEDQRFHLELEVWLNGEKFGDDTLANMSWSFEEMIAYASRGTRVVPGDVLASGTCGAGCLLEVWGRRGRRDPDPLAPGDVVEMVVEGIGRIRNTVIANGHLVPEIPTAHPPQHRRARAW
jgi:2-keto-4-pentenoate hydratase/2-oxohepta-3-ene-1,7-dioic acid hydratase in catechol pathway